MGRRRRGEAAVAVAATALSAALLSGNVPGTAAVCDICQGLSEDACFAAVKGGVVGMEEASQLALYEHVFAGDICDGMDSGTCLTHMSDILASMSTAQERETLIKICDEDLLTEYSYLDSESSEANKRCSMCEGLSDSSCLGSIDSMIASLTTEFAISALRSVFAGKTADSHCDGLDDSSCVETLRASLGSIEDSSRLLAYENACSEDSMNFQHMDKSVGEDTDAEAADLAGCTPCEGETKGRCLMTLNAAVRTLSNNDRLTLLEDMFAGDFCEDKSDAECLQHLDLMFSSEKDDQRLKRLLSVCVADLDMLVVPEAKYKTAEVVSMAASCPLCDGTNDDNECLDVMESNVALLSNDDRLTLLKDMLSEKYTCSDSLSDRQCLKFFDLQVATYTSSERLDMLAQACSEGQLESSVTPDDEMAQSVEALFMELAASTAASANTETLKRGEEAQGGDASGTGSSAGAGATKDGEGDVEELAQDGSIAGVEEAEEEAKGAFFTTRGMLGISSLMAGMMFAAMAVMRRRDAMSKERKSGLEATPLMGAGAVDRSQYTVL